MVIEKESSSLKKLFDFLNNAGDGLYKLYKKTESISGKLPEITATLLYVVLHIVVSIFHEPWFDEAVSWQIAKCASIEDILFYLPHYEGHPPLWHLILVPFAKLGCPYEFSLSLVSLIFSGLAMALLIFRSPFPRIIRLLLPFTYFLGYQYNIISRPYCVMMLAIVLAAMTYKNKDTKPWRFVLSLMLLCLSSAYGIVIAGGITIAWLIELFGKERFRLLLNKSRTISLLCLLVLAILLILEILPAEDAFALSLRNISENTNLFVRLLYVFFVMPADTCITNVFSFRSSLPVAELSPVSVVSGIFIGLLIWTAVLYIAKRRGTLLQILIPYCLFALFSAVVYIYLHHIGVALLIFIYWAWISCISEAPVRKPMKDEIGAIGVSMLRIFGSAALLLSLYWGISASVHEITYIYDIGKYEAEYIKEQHLDDYNIMIGYTSYYEYDGNSEAKLIGYDMNHCMFPDPVLAYFDRNIFFNLNGGADDMAYTLHKVAGKDDCTELIAKWREQGAPDVIFIPPEGSAGFGEYIEADISAIYDGITDISDYRLVYYRSFRQVWKNTYNSRYATIYVRKDLADELGLEKADILS